MAKMNLNLVLTNRIVVKATKPGCDAVAMTNGRGMPPTLSSWQHVLPRFAVLEPTYESPTYEEPATWIAISAADRPGSQVFSFGRSTPPRDTSRTSSCSNRLTIVSDKGRSGRHEQHRRQHDHDYPSQDRHDAMQNGGMGLLQTPRGLVCTTGNRK